MPELRKLQQVQQGSIHIASVSQGNVRMITEAQNVIIHTGGLPQGGLEGDLLMKRSNADYEVEWVTPANSVEQDNTRPITAAAVYREVGNINALLATI